VGTLILDASVLIGLLDTADAHHNQAVDDLEAADLAGESCSPASEALVSFTRAGRIRDAREAADDMLTPLRRRVSPDLPVG
jgi:predicted nucleic acid-binding protein